MNPSKRALKVFLCYGSEDGSRVRPLYYQLARTPSFDPWLDKEKLIPGQNWDLEIKAALRAADAVLVCLSTQAVAKEGYVQREIKRALEIAEEKLETSIFIIPVRLDDCKVPERLMRWQWLDYFAPEAEEKLFRSLHARAQELKIDSAIMDPIDWPEMLYDSKGDDFSSWTLFSESRKFDKVRQHATGPLSQPEICLDIHEESKAAIGVNKAIQSLYGRVVFDYEVLDGIVEYPNIYFCAIPMQARRGLIEVGTNTQGHADNATSLYRIRELVPVSEARDGLSHSIEMRFDFRKLPTASYTIIAARINEGSRFKGAAYIRLKRVRIFAGQKQD